MASRAPHREAGGGVQRELAVAVRRVSAPAPPGAGRRECNAQCARHSSQGVRWHALPAGVELWRRLGLVPAARSALGTAGSRGPM
jgi:hypothetical protein